MNTKESTFYILNQDENDAIKETSESDQDDETDQSSDNSQSDESSKKNDNLTNTPEPTETKLTSSIYNFVNQLNFVTNCNFFA